MAKLRSGTTQAHLAIEQSPSMRAIFCDSYTIGDYRRLLQNLLGFYEPFEAEVFGKLPRSFATKFDNRRKASWLAADLCALGIHATRVSDGSGLRFTSFEERMGALYVTEGATLGGKIIRKRLRDHLGEAAEPALRFYSGYGTAAGTQWRAFGNELSALFDGADEPVQARVVAGANRTFAALEAWLNADHAAAHG